METLKRKLDLGVRRSMQLSDGTLIELIGMTARKYLQIMNNKQLSEMERGMNVIASKILVNGNPICFDDFLDQFTDDDVVKITEFVTADTKETEKNA